MSSPGAPRAEGNSAHEKVWLKLFAFTPMSSQGSSFTMSDQEKYNSPHNNAYLSPHNI